MNRRSSQIVKGQQFGMLTVLEKAGSTGRETIWRCRCECGNEVNVAASCLRSGNTKSCGCLKAHYQQQLRGRLHVVDNTCLEWVLGRKMRNDNKSGHPGIYKKRRNGKYSVFIGFKKKIYHLGTYMDYEDALRTRLSAEDAIHAGFVESYAQWKDKSEKDPEWAKLHPFRFDVEKDGQGFIIDTTFVRKKIEL